MTGIRTDCRRYLFRDHTAKINEGDDTQMRDFCQHYRKFLCEKDAPCYNCRYYHA